MQSHLRAGIRRLQPQDWGRERGELRRGCGELRFMLAQVRATQVVWIRELRRREVQVHGQVRGPQVREVSQRRHHVQQGAVPGELPSRVRQLRWGPGSGLQRLRGRLPHRRPQLRRLWTQVPHCCQLQMKNNLDACQWFGDEVE